MNVSLIIKFKFTGIKENKSEYKRKVQIDHISVMPTSQLGVGM